MPLGGNHVVFKASHMPLNLCKIFFFHIYVVCSRNASSSSSVTQSSVSDGNWDYQTCKKSSLLATKTTHINPSCMHLINGPCSQNVTKHQIRKHNIQNLCLVCGWFLRFAANLQGSCTWQSGVWTTDAFCCRNLLIFQVSQGSLYMQNTCFRVTRKGQSDHPSLDLPFLYFHIIKE